MNGKKVELLAPAGNYEAFLGAVHAGADAIYLGGQRFGARAYAKNFTDEEICRAIRYAHLHGKKVYLTVNTLFKDKELQEMRDCLAPFYECGLDAAIVQDIGAFAYIRRHFPGLALHASTQMSITGAYGAKLLKEMGARRIVPARELSLVELAQIKDSVAIEVETFIHGAMCYCYSGCCLFSSLLGARSGNRGRCAQPCRLPYKTDGKRNGEKPYPLSLKDLCTVWMLPQLIQAGIDSFKIEGRMKKPEYAAGVTAVYRKYIDRYYADPGALYRVEEQDLLQLQTLYCRSGLQDGYYGRHNGAEMITPKKPSYMGCDEALLANIRKTYIERGGQLPVFGTLTLRAGFPAKLRAARGIAAAEVEEGIVERAKKQPLTAEGLKKQLQKTGNTPFVFSSIEVDIKEPVFLPVKTINELRRKALQELEEALCAPRQKTDAPMAESAPHRRFLQPKTDSAGKQMPFLTAETTTKEQLQAACASGRLGRIYVPSDLFLENDVQEWLAGQNAMQNIHTGYIKEAPAFYIALPHILRRQSSRHLEQLQEALENMAHKPHLAKQAKGMLLRNLEELEWLSASGWTKEAAADANLYAWNGESRDFFEKWGITPTAPLELNEKELRCLGLSGMEIVVYGRLPMMASANCIRKTNGQCQDMGGQGRQNGQAVLTDRFKKIFPVITYCSHCYNMIYNSVPLSLHQHVQEIAGYAPDSMRLSFTVETGRETAQIINFFYDKLHGIKDSAPPYADYTNGHFKRGVE